MTCPVWMLPNGHPDPLDRRTEGCVRPVIGFVTVAIALVLAAAGAVADTMRRRHG